MLPMFPAQGTCDVGTVLVVSQTQFEAIQVSFLCHLHRLFSSEFPAILGPPKTLDEVSTNVGAELGS